MLFTKMMYIFQHLLFFYSILIIKQTPITYNAYICNAICYQMRGFKINFDYKQKSYSKFNIVRATKCRVY